MWHISSEWHILGAVLITPEAAIDSGQLPFRDAAQVPLEKVRDYLLSDTHPIGSLKAQFFRAFGFTAARPDELATALRAIAMTEDVTSRERSRYGSKYTVEGYITGPIGSSVFVRTVWIVEVGTEYPRFITAYPVRRRQG